MVPTFTSWRNRRVDEPSHQQLVARPVGLASRRSNRRPPSRAAGVSQGPAESIRPPGWPPRRRRRPRARPAARRPARGRIVRPRRRAAPEEREHLGAGRRRPLRGAVRRQAAGTWGDEDHRGSVPMRCDSSSTLTSDGARLRHPHRGDERRLLRRLRHLRGGHRGAGRLHRRVGGAARHGGVEDLAQTAGGRRPAGGTVPPDGAPGRPRRRRAESDGHPSDTAAGATRGTTGSGPARASSAPARDPPPTVMPPTPPPQRRRAPPGRVASARGSGAGRVRLRPGPSAPPSCSRAAAAAAPCRSACSRS